MSIINLDKAQDVTGTEICDYSKWVPFRWEQDELKATRKFNVVNYGNNMRRSHHVFLAAIETSGMCSAGLCRTAFRLDPERYFLHAASVQTGQAASEPKKVRLISTEFWQLYMTRYMNLDAIYMCSRCVLHAVHPTCSRH